MARHGFDSDQAIGFCARCAGAESRNCRSMRRAIRNKCEVDDNNSFRRGRQRIHDRLSNSRRRNRGGLQVRNKTWKDNHCGALLFNPNMDPASLQRRMQELSQGAQEMKEDLLAVLDGIAPDIAAEMAITYGQRALARQGAAALCGPGAVVCTGALAVFNVASGLWTAWGAWDEISSVTDMVESQLNRLNDIQGHAEEVIGAIGNEPELQRLREGMLAEMAQAAASDDCIQARRCFLVPHTNKESQVPGYNRGTTGSNRTGGRAGLFDSPTGAGASLNPFSLGDSRGCCPGQTGHHLIPQSWLFDGSVRNGTPRCTNYRHGAAPTACVEGYDGRYGTHGDAHRQLNQEIERRGAEGESMSMNDAINLAVNGYTRRGSPGFGCDPDCLKEQLRNYYDEAGCGDVVPQLQPGIGGDDDSGGDSNGGEMS